MVMAKYVKDMEAYVYNNRKLISIEILYIRELLVKSRVLLFVCFFRAAPMVYGGSQV